MAQAIGGAIISAQKASSYNTGRWVIIIGLVIQVLFFGLFLVTGVIFHARLVKEPTLAFETFVWKKHIGGLVYWQYAYLGDAGGYLITHEAFAYVIDALLMLAVMLVFFWVRPSEIQMWIRGKEKVTKHGIDVVDATEMEGCVISLDEEARTK
ncbi:hypothetical protein E4T47_00049 [Aureobasidium subglaciale]|nr:hypothetical protein E4T47_00049 [Aureobasidium subglaciale]